MFNRFPQEHKRTHATHTTDTYAHITIKPKWNASVNMCIRIILQSNEKLTIMWYTLFRVFCPMKLRSLRIFWLLPLSLRLVLDVVLWFIAACFVSYRLVFVSTTVISTWVFFSFQSFSTRYTLLLILPPTCTLRNLCYHLFSHP